MAEPAETLTLYHWDKSLLYLVMKLLGKDLSVWVHNGFGPEIEDRGEVRHGEKAEHVGHECRVVPPTDGVARRHFAFGCSISDRDVRYWHISIRGEFKKGRVERKDLFTFCARPFRKNDHA